MSLGSNVTLEELKDPLHISIEPIIRARSKRILETLNGLIHEVQDDSTTIPLKMGPKEDHGLINIIKSIDWAD